MECGNSENISRYADDDDTYIRKNAYLIMGRLYRDHPESRARILERLENLFRSDDEKVRQTAVYATGEIWRTGGAAERRPRMLPGSLKSRLLTNITLSETL